MKTESNVRPQCIERYDNLIRVNYDVKEVARTGTDGNSYNMYVYQMVELRGNLPDLQSLISILITEKYSSGVTDDNSFLHECKRMAMEVLDIPVTLDFAKEGKMLKLSAYDQSDAVNGFIIRTEGGDVTEWLDTYKRSNAFRAIDSAKKLGDESISFAIGDIPVTLAVTTAEIYLARVEKYAVTCTNVTASHKAAINALDTVEDVEAYDFTVGYPQRLTFSVENV